MKTCKTCIYSEPFQEAFVTCMVESDRDSRHHETRIGCRYHTEGEIGKHTESHQLKPGSKFPPVGIPADTRLEDLMKRHNFVLDLIWNKAPKLYEEYSIWKERQEAEGKEPFSNLGHYPEYVAVKIELEKCKEKLENIRWNYDALLQSVRVKASCVYAEHCQIVMEK